MKKYCIKKSILIEAPRKAVWEVLLKPGNFAEWATSFSPGSKMKAVWKLGGRARYSDKDGYGLTGKVTAFEPEKKVTVKYDGALVDFRPAPPEESQHNWKGCRETYKLTDKDGGTLFAVDSEVPTKEFFDDLNKIWDPVLVKIKKMAEKRKAHAAK